MAQRFRNSLGAAIKRGRFDQPADTTKLTPRPGAGKTIEAANLGAAYVVDDDKTLDQVIIDYLASEAESEHLELSLLNTIESYAGTPIELRVATKKSLSQNPIAAAAIEVKVISTVDPPRVIFGNPQLAAVGLTLGGAIERGMKARAYDVPSSGTAGASFYGRNTEGTSRIVVDEADGVIVGATFTGTDVAEWLHAATIAIISRTPVDRLRVALPVFPTRSEIWLKLLERRESVLADERSAGPR